MLISNEHYLYLLVFKYLLALFSSQASLWAIPQEPSQCYSHEAHFKYEYFLCDMTAHWGSRAERRFAVWAGSIENGVTGWSHMIAYSAGIFASRSRNILQSFFRCHGRCEMHFIDEIQLIMIWAVIAEETSIRIWIEDTHRMSDLSIACSNAERDNVSAFLLRYAVIHRSL